MLSDAAREAFTRGLQIAAIVSAAMVALTALVAAVLLPRTRGGAA